MNRMELALFNNLQKYILQMAEDMRKMRELIEKVEKEKRGF